MGDWDRTILFWINGWSDDSSPFWVFWSTALNSWWIKAPLILLVVAMIGFGQRSRRGAILALIAWPVADGTCSLLKKVAPFLRPYVTEPSLHLRVGQGDASGTASSHAANMACVATVFWLVLGWRWGVIWTLVALLTGISRVYVGAHWPSQVLLGWTLGLAVGWLVVRAAVALLTRFSKSRGNTDAVESA